jgi:hypothetical protein
MMVELPESAAHVATDPLRELTIATKAEINDLRLATKSDLAEFESRLAWKIGGTLVGAMVSLTGVFALIVGWPVKHT